MGTLAGLLAVAPSTQILVDGYRLKADAKGYYGTIRFWFAGSDLHAFSAYVAGASQSLTITAGSGSVAITRLVPLLHPYVANCYADDIDIYPPEGSVASYDGVAIAFADWFADIHFSTPTFAYESGPMPTVVMKLDSKSEMVTRPGSAFKFLSDGTNVNHDVGVPVKVQTFSLTNNLLPSLDDSLYLELAGNVNSTEFLGCPIGTVLYEGCSSSGEYTIGGLPSYNATHTFEYRSVPHNQIMRPDGSGFDTPVWRSDDETMMLPSADLNQLWGM